jgi:hypothetical protein
MKLWPFLCHFRTIFNDFLKKIRILHFIVLPCKALEKSAFYRSALKYQRIAHSLCGIFNIRQILRSIPETIKNYLLSKLKLVK